MYEPAQRPLSDRELRIVRGMIDEHLMHEMRRRTLWRRLSLGERVFLVFASFLALVPNIIDLVLRVERIK